MPQSAHRETARPAKPSYPAMLSLLALLVANVVSPIGAQAQGLGAPGSTVAEDNFREVFLTAGYSAAFGAALGAATLPFLPSPSLSSLRYVAGGASLGFIVGSGIAFFNLSSSPREANTFGTPHDESQDAGFDDYEVNPVSQTRAPLRLAPQLPVGAVVVGNGSSLGLSLPAFTLVGRGALVNVLDYRF